MPLTTKEKGFGFKEKDLEKSLASDGKKDEPQPKAQELFRGVADTDLKKDYQLKRAVELLQSVSMLKDKGFL